MTTQRFLNKVVIITGSSAGIGQNAAIEFAKEGASVVIHGRDARRLDEIKAQILASGVPSKNILQIIGPIEDERTAQKIVRETLRVFGRIDVLINNAACDSKAGVADQMDIENLDYIYQVNFRSVVLLTTLALPHLEHTKGNVLNVSSTVAIRPLLGCEFYGCLKAALDHWTRAMALKYGDKGIRVNGISPGPTNGTMIVERDGQRVPVDAKYGDMTVLGRMGRPSEISTVMKFLCSDEASYITGACLLVDGGMALCPAKI